MQGTYVFREKFKKSIYAFFSVYVFFFIGGDMDLREFVVCEKSFELTFFKRLWSLAFL